MMPTRADSPKPSRLWWVYFGYLVLCFIVYIDRSVGLIKLALDMKFAYAASLLNLPLALTILAATFALDVWATVGFWGFLRSKPLGVAWVWRACLALQLVRFVAVVIVNVRSGTALKIVDAANLMLTLPLLLALWQYGWLSPHLWKRLPDTAEAGAA